MRIGSLFTCLLVLSACATGEPGMAARTLDPVGAYTFSTTIQGTPAEGQMRITGEPGSWTGSLYTDVTGELPFSSVSVEARTLFLSADTPDGTVRIQLRFDGDTFAGDWSMGADGGSVRGRRVRN